MSRRTSQAERTRRKARDLAACTNVDEFNAALKKEWLPRLMRGAYDKHPFARWIERYQSEREAREAQRAIARSYIEVPAGLALAEGGRRAESE